jgi:hypothetical protein
MRAAIFPNCSHAIRLFLVPEAVMSAQPARLFPQAPEAANSNARAMFSLRVVTRAEPDPRSTPWSKPVRISAPSDPQPCGELPADLFDLAGLVGWLRSRFPSSTEFHVEAVTGISSASVANWIQRRSRPSAEHWSLLLCVFGPRLFKATVRRSAGWVDRACEAERLHEIEMQISALTEERQRLIG